MFSPNTGIVDWGQVARKFGEVFTKQGGEIKTGYEVNFWRYFDFEDELHFSSSNSLIYIFLYIALSRSVEF